MDGEPPADRRFPRWVYGVGSEPDPRFSLANERTFLAWIRTALALSAAGVAIEALEVPIDGRLRLASAVLLVGLGLLAPIQGWLGWAATERAMRESRPLPGPWLSVLLAAGIVLVALLVLVGLLLP